MDIFICNSCNRHLDITSIDLSKNYTCDECGEIPITEISVKNVYVTEMSIGGNSTSLPPIGSNLKNPSSRKPVTFAFDSLDSVRKKLIDLTNRNYLLNYRHPKASCLRLIDELPDQIVEVLSLGRTFTFIPVPEPTESELIHERYIEIDPVTREKKYREHPTAEQWAKCKGLATSYELPEINLPDQDRHQDTKLQTLMYAPELEARSRSIRGKSETAIEESGANILYLVLGFLEWYESRDSDVARLAPLFTLPVRMERKKFERGEGTFRYTITLKDDGLLTNVPLREKLANDFGLILPALDDEETPEDYFQKVSQTILISQPKWKIRRQATLSLLNFSKQVMYEDLNPSRWPGQSAIQNHPIIKQFFASASTEYCQADIGYSSEHNIDEIKKIHDLFPLIYEADSSQHSALIDAIKGENIVIEGPPGSGKSQTITNLIAASIANEKRVLFVAEKMAALDVVKNRLDQAGLGDFCLELHSHKTQKLKILGDLQSRVNKQAGYRYPSDIDTDIARYEDLKGKLQKYVEVINTPWKETGLTIHEILNKATRYREQLKIDPDQFQIKVEGKFFTQTKLKELFDQAEMLADIFDQVASQSSSGKISDHYWYGVNNTELLGYQTEALCTHVKEWTDQLSGLMDFWEKHVQEMQLGLDVNSSITRIEEHAAGLERLPVLMGEEPLSCIESLLEQPSQFESFLNVYREIHKSMDQLGEAVSQEAFADTSCCESLKELLHKLAQMKVPQGVSLQELNDDLLQAQKMAEDAQSVATGFKRITPKIPEAMKVAFEPSPRGIDEFLRLIALIEKLPNELWRSRAQLYDEDDLDPLLDQLCSQLQVLTPLHAKLLKVFSLHRLPDEDVLRDAWSVYQAGGFFRVFSSQWSKAKKSIVSLASSPKPDKKEVLGLVPQLLDYVKSVSVINDLNQQEPILGDLFKGVETPLSRILEIRKWYKEVRAEYGQGFGDRVAIGDALLTLDRNIAMGVLDYAVQELFARSNRIVEGVKHFQERFSEQRSFFDEKASLAEESSLFTQIEQTLVTPLNVLQKFILSSSTSIKQLTVIQEALTSLHSKQEGWRQSPIKNLLDVNNFELFTDPGAYSEDRLKQAENLLSIIHVLNEEEFLKQSLVSLPNSKRYEDLKAAIPKFEQCLSGCATAWKLFFQMGKVSEKEWSESSAGNISSLIVKNENALAKTKWLPTWTDYIKVKKRLTNKGLEDIIARLEENQYTTRELCDVLTLCVSHKLAKEIFNAHNYLANFSGLEQNAIRNKFRHYDRKIQELQQAKIAFRASRTTPPQGIAAGRVSAYTEMGLINQEMGKRKRHIAVRSLMKRAGRAIQSLKPCFMMSPMSVAQYLEPGRFEFDLIVMDEASQIKPEDALGAVARGKSFVVVGDPKQLPPTSFFQKIVDADSDEDIVALQESESILEAVIPMFKNRRLRWHYRSRHESLIAFSNQHFYDSNLILFPSPLQKSDKLGIRYERLKKGRFHSRRNVEEARKIVSGVAEQLISNPDESVGIVAMNSEQRDEIEQQLDQCIKDNDRLRMVIERNRSSKEPLFIKNLENVQGDERDVIFISMTYGPEQIGGRTMQRFGPINLNVGWRRLNVLFTRSKMRMHIYSSMGSDDVLVTSASSRGVKSLRAFLEYCETGHLHEVKHTGKAADSDFEIAVMKMLDEHGYECEPQLGVAGFFLDLAVKDPGKPGRFLMGIECDGATYHSAKSARDRDRLRQEILEGLGWNISRVWSTDWFKNPEACLRPILQELDGLKTVIPEAEITWSDMSPEEASGENVLYQGADNIPLESKKEDEPQFGDVEVSLRERLLDFQREVIAKEQPETELEKSLLRPALLESMLNHMPCSKGEFLVLIPAHLRYGTAASEGKYIGPVCELIADYG